MEATKNQYDVSQLLVRRCQEQFANKFDSEEKKESNCFFYWIMQQMEKKVELNYWDRHFYEIALEAKVYRYDGPLVILCGKERYEHSQKLTHKQFREIMKEMAGIINTLPNFTASYVENDLMGIILYVNMVIPLDDN